MKFKQELKNHSMLMKLFLKDLEIYLKMNLKNNRKLFMRIKINCPKYYLLKMIVSIHPKSLKQNQLLKILMKMNPINYPSKLSKIQSKKLLMPIILLVSYLIILILHSIIIIRFMKNFTR